MTYNKEAVARLIDNPLLINGDELIAPNYLRPNGEGFLRICAAPPLGVHLDSLEVSANDIEQRLRAEGISEEAIADHIVYFTDVDTLDLGTYMYDEKVIQVHTLGTLIQCMHKLATKIQSEKTAFSWDIDETNELASKTISETIYHEIRHTAQYEHNDPVIAESERYHKDFSRKRVVKRLLGAATSLAIATSIEVFGDWSNSLVHATAAGISIIGIACTIAATRQTTAQQLEHSKNAPLELDAERAAREAPSSLVSLRLDIKPIVDAMQKHYGALQ